jgi:hypothetical protein
VLKYIYGAISKAEERHWISIVHDGRERRQIRTDVVDPETKDIGRLVNSFPEEV